MEIGPREVRSVPFEWIARILSLGLIATYLVLWLREDTAGDLLKLSPVFLLAVLCVWFPRRLSFGRREGALSTNRWSGSPPEALVYLGLLVLLIPGIIGAVIWMARST